MVMAEARTWEWPKRRRAFRWHRCYNVQISMALSMWDGVQIFVIKQFLTNLPTHGNVPLILMTLDWEGATVNPWRGTTILHNNILSPPTIKPVNDSGKGNDIGVTKNMPLLMEVLQNPNLYWLFHMKRILFWFKLFIWKILVIQWVSLTLPTHGSVPLSLCTNVLWSFTHNLYWKINKKSHEVTLTL